MRRSHRASVGQAAERRAEQLLIERGYRIVARNYRCRQGEIDLIAWQSGVLVFVEVRCRREGYTTAAESVNRVKRRRIAMTARHYLALHPTDSPCRFDVVCIWGDRVELLTSAFSLDDIV